jgi:type I restriction enzyme S subunit
MDAQQFLVEFGHIANAPGGVGKLREMILAMAMTGKLLSIEIAESASDLIRTVETELCDYKKKYQYRRSSNEDLTDKSVAYPVPGNWVRVSLGRLGL